MIIYEATKKEFLEQVLDDCIVDKIIDAHHKYNYNQNNKSEIRSWRNSMQYMSNVLSTDSVPDNAGIAIEFKIPLTGNRVDFMISGYDEKNQGKIIIIELKQWEEANPIMRHLWENYGVSGMVGAKLAGLTFFGFQAKKTGNNLYLVGPSVLYSLAALAWYLK